MTSKIIQQGAEAIITRNNNQVIKNRIKKSYRIKEIDEKLRKTRTKSEAKIISKLQNIIPVPKIIETDDKQEITMEYIDGKKLSDNLEKLNYKEICKQISENITKLHNQNIVHGDLTTSNMIYVEDKTTEDSLNQQSTLHHNFNTEIEDSNKKDLEINKDKSAKQANKRSLLSKDIQSNKSEIANSKIYFIDFGLAFHSQKIEDKAVDLHLLQQALEAKHFTIWQDCLRIILDNYKAEKHKEILERIKVIESRGRYKEKY